MKLFTKLFICSLLFSSLKRFALLATYRVKRNKTERSVKILRDKLTNKFNTSFNLSSWRRYLHHCCVGKNNTLVALHGPPFFIYQFNLGKKLIAFPLNNVTDNYSLLTSSGSGNYTILTTFKDIVFHLKETDQLQGGWQSWGKVCCKRAENEDVCMTYRESGKKHFASHPQMYSYPFFFHLSSL